MKIKTGTKNSPRAVFRNEIRGLLRQLKFKVYDEFDHYDFEGRKFPVLGCLNEKYLDPLKSSLLYHRYKAVDIDTPNFRGLYIEETSELAGLFIAPKKSFVSLAPDILNQSRDVILAVELQAFGKKNNLVNLIQMDQSSFLALWRGDNYVLSEVLGVPFVQISSIKFYNNHREYKRHYLKFRNNHRYQAGPGSYNNIEIFSRIYYWEIKIMAGFFKNAGVTVHDAGTCTAQLPLLLSGLTREALFGLDVSKIYASDNGWTGMRFIKEIINENPGYKPVTFLKLDLSGDFEAAPAADAVIANDVLEHLENDEASFSALKKLWDKTEKLLIVHVPYEDKPNPSWGHHNTFNENKIRDWSRRLPGGRFISDRYYEDDKETLAGHGFLIVSRV